MNKVKVYRSGVVAAPTQRGIEMYAEAAADCTAVDAVRPTHCPVGRTDAIFASPTLEGVTRWVLGNEMTGIEDIRVRSITVDADSVMVYSVTAWERYSWGFKKDAKAAEAYWATGMTLTEWLSRDDLDASEWELLLNDESILSTANVSDARVIAAGPRAYVQSELKKAFKRSADNMFLANHFAA